MKKTIIFDGSNLLHRCYWVSSVRRNVSVVQLFLSSMKKCTNMFKADQVICVWDAKTVKGRNYRYKTTTGEYKGTRDREKAAKVYEHSDRVQEVSATLGVIHLNPGILEADDFIYWLCGDISNHKTIISSDGDLLQLVSDSCEVYNPIVNKLITMETFEEITGLPDISSYILYKSLIGDKSDNIPGLSKVGPKRAMRIIEQGIDTLSATDAALLEHNLQLIDLSNAVHHHPEEFALYKETYYNVKSKTKRDFIKFKKLCIENELFAISNKLSDWTRVFDKTQSIENIVAKLIKLNKSD